MGAAPIGDVRLWQALDSRGNPTVAARVAAGSGVGHALAPAGASAGSHEAIFIRDGDSREYSGRSVRQHLERMQGHVREALIGVDGADPAAVDAALRALDPDPQMGRIGGNIGTAVSVAAWLAAADAASMEPWSWLSTTIGRRALIPMPMVNIISGGAHAGSMIDIQDILVVPIGAERFSDAIEWCWRVRAGTRQVLDEMGFVTALVADEGGLAAAFDADERAIEAVVAGIERAGLKPGLDVSVALDVAATECQVPGGYRMLGSVVGSDDFVDRIIGWRSSYPIVSIEDGAGEDDAAGWARLAVLCANTQVLGDDRYVTTVSRMRDGMARSEANSVLVKPNQAGTLGQALQVVQTALDAGWAPVVSARSGETEETWLADLATGSGAGQIKVGSTMRSERTAKWNRLLYLEQAHGLPYAGAAALAPRYA